MHQIVRFCKELLKNNKVPKNHLDMTLTEAMVAKNSIVFADSTCKHHGCAEVKPRPYVGLNLAGELWHPVMDMIIKERLLIFDQRLILRRSFFSIS